MPYTLVMMSVWLVLAVALGIVTGWLLRNVTARRQISRSRSQRSDVAELDRLRRRVAELEGIATERDRLAAEFASRTGLGAAAATTATTPTTPTTPTTSIPSIPPNEPGSSNEVVGAPTTPNQSPNPSKPERDSDDGDAASAPAAVVAEIDGRVIVLDDLKAVEGIGPTVEDLCHGIGIRGWSDLAHTEVSLLRTMLDDAGARFKMNDPTTWPHQAELLADQRWDEFAKFTASLRSNADDLGT
jgi:predicted flap endonuclease-1-like 5' DNA nuclease